MSLNKFMFHGRLTKAPETRTTKKQNGEDFKIVITDIAVNSSRKDESGNYATDFFTIKAFDSKAEQLSKLTKGSELIVTGNIRNHKYQNNEGKMVYTNEFIVDSLDYCGKKADNTSVTDTNGQNIEAQYNNATNGGNTNKNVVDSKNIPDVSDDDLPF